MAWRIILTFPDMVGDHGNDLSHRVRNFGEWLFRYFMDKDEGHLDWAEVDAATNRLIVHGIRSKRVRRIVQLLSELAEQDFPERSPEITTEKAG